jgi:ATP-dependent helicase Lhr and Lhr-like helicase
VAQHVQSVTRPTSTTASEHSLRAFHPATRQWFTRVFDAPTEAQKRAFLPISRGESTLLLAPTGSGKTLAAFLVAIDKLLFEAEPPKRARCRVLYVSPIKALAFDVEKNLRSPLFGITAEARALGHEPRDVTIEIRTGDTPQATRVRIAKTPPDILVTTPESLYLMLTSAARSVLASVDTVIVDEIHSVIGSKRGAHFFLSLERLEALRPADAPPLQRIGLSATVQPLEEAATLLGGFADDGKPRPVTIANAKANRALDVRIEVPVDDMAKLGEEEDGPPRQSGTLPRRSIWPSIYPRVLELIRAHRSTMIFVNSRRLSERLAAALNEAAGEELVACHHGSLARESRLLVEDRLKRGLLPAIVATSSLELGVDMGAVDLVIQVEAPPSVASALQRVGRAGHGIGRTSVGVVFPKHRGDLLAAAAVRGEMLEGRVEATAYPRLPLDILAQHIVAHVAITAGPGGDEAEGDRAGAAGGGVVTRDSVLALVRRAAPFAGLSDSTFDHVLDMLSGRYPSDDFGELRARLTWDRLRGTLRPRRGAQRLAVVSGGTIPDRGLYGVFLVGDGESSRRVGELDEEMVFESREGEVVVLGTSSWRIEEIGLDRVLVSPAPGEPGKMPFWHGDRPSRPLALGRAIGALTRTLLEEGSVAATTRLREHHGLDDRAARNLVAYLDDQMAAVGAAPTDRQLVVERYRDDLGDARVCILSPYGSAVHAPWATTVVQKLRERAVTVDVMWTDDGIVFRLPEADDDTFRLEDFFPAASEVREAVTASLGASALFASHFRENAARSLLLPRKMPGRRTPLWAQRKRAGDLLAVASRYPDFPIVLETFRECLSDVFDLDGLGGLLRDVEARRVRVRSVQSERPSPFAASLMFSYVAQFLYEGDAPLAERRAQALRIDHGRLRELLGEEELRRLLDEDVLLTTVEKLQRLEPRATRPVLSQDALHDLLLALGDATAADLARRCRASSVEDAPDAPVVEVEKKLLDLLETRRIFSFSAVSTAGRAARATARGPALRYAAAEDGARYRDGLGIALPVGLPVAFQRPVDEPLLDLVSRYARTHGPFVVQNLADQWGVSPELLEPTLALLVQRERLVAGAFLPADPARGRGPAPIEYVGAEVLALLKRRSLAKLRKEIEPVSEARFAAFCAEWQGVGGSSKRPLLEAVAALDGAPLPALILERDVLPSRVTSYEPSQLDALFLSGDLVWAGIDATGPSLGHGRVALYLREHEALLSPPPVVVPGELAERLRQAFVARGALFFPDLVAIAGGPTAEVFETLWAMVWSGELTNDTLLPLRSLLASRGVRSFRSAARPPGTEGRWSLRASRLLSSSAGGEAPSATERAAALARTLLTRHGVLLREAVQSEGVVGGFSALYPVLKLLEERGEVRRGYFVAGRGALQFARPGADDALRNPRPTPAALALAAMDPAQPYGALLRWPEGADGRFQRSPGAYVLSRNGQPVGYLGRGERTLFTLLPEEEAGRKEALATIVEALRSLLGRPTTAAASLTLPRHRALLLVSIDGVPALQSPLLRELLALGVTAGSAGLLVRPIVKAPPPTAGRTGAAVSLGRASRGGAPPPAGGRGPRPAEPEVFVADDDDEIERELLEAFGDPLDEDGDDHRRGD